MNNQEIILLGIISNALRLNGINSYDLLSNINVPERINYRYEENLTNNNEYEENLINNYKNGENLINNEYEEYGEINLDNIQEPSDFLFINRDLEMVTKEDFEKYLELLDNNLLSEQQKKLLENKMTPIENTKNNKIKLQNVDNENYFIGPQLNNNELRNIKNIIETPEPFYIPEGVNYVEKLYKYRQDVHSECTFCLEKFKEGDYIYRTFCSHIIHKNCMEMWLSDNSHCPVCSTKF